MMRRLFSTAVMIAGTVISTMAQPTLVEKVEASPGKVVIPYEKWKLSNGLTVLLHEDHSDPVVNVMVTYKVGSNREDIGKSGFAHFFEHMMFQGSKHVGDEEHFKLISAAGGEMNGFTERDRTVYYETVPANYLELALWLEADRMGFLLDSLYARKFENQRDAVKNEKSQNFENQPYALAFTEELGKALYPAGHPYNMPVIGYVDDLNRATLEDVRNFFLRWYGPNNAILSVSGDFKPQEALQWIEKYFGGLKQCPEVKKLRAPLVTVPSDKYTAYRDKIYLPLNLRVFPTVPLHHRDEPALDLLSLMIGSGKNSVFYKNFVKSKEAIQASVGHYCAELSGEFQIQIFAYPPDDFNLEKLFTDLDNKVKSSIEEFGQSGITDEALVRAKSQMESRIYNVLNSVFEKNQAISEWERLLGKSYTVSDELDRYSRVTKEDITRVFNKYVKGAGAVILNTYPITDQKDSVKSVNPYAGREFPANPEYKGLTYSPNKDNFDRMVRPKPAAPVTPRVPDYFRKKLPNGLELIGTANNEIPEVTMLFTIEGGSLVFGNDKLKKMGTAELTAQMLNEGTKNRTTEEISAEMEKLGSTITFNAGKVNNIIRVQSLKKNLDATLKLLEEKLLSPGFRDEDFKLVKKQYKESLKDDETNPNLVASKLFNYSLYGNSAMGLPATVKSVDNVELSDVKEYYENYYSPSVTYLVIVGDITESEILPKLDFLNKWNAKPVTVPPVPDPAPAAEPRYFVYNKSLAPSSVIMMGYPSLKYDATGDYYKNRIANFAFGGNFNSRINLNLREDKGYTYGIYSGFSGGKYAGYYQIGASVKRSTTALALAEILREFEKYQSTGITDNELEFTKNSMLNSEALKYEEPYQKASFLSEIVRYNLEKDFTARQSQILKAMTKEELNQQIKTHFDPNKLVTVIVGDKWIIESQIDRAAKEARNKQVLNKVKLKKISID